jgi:hypothetical protein
MIVKILDDNNQPIPGAIIRNKNNPALGISTDENGIATISVAGEYIINFVGSKEKIVNITEDITIILSSDDTVLNEIEIVAESFKNALIKGFIVDDKGDPLINMGVRILVIGNKETPSVPTTSKNVNDLDINITPSSVLSAIKNTDASKQETNLGIGETKTIYIKTNDKGYFEDNSFTKGLIETNNSSITINPLEYNYDVKYKVEEIDLSTIFPKIEVPLKYWMYDLGRINLEMAAKMPTIDEIVSQIKNDALEKTPRPKLGFEFSLSAIQLKLLNAALERLVPFLFGILLTFGPQVVAAVFNKQKVLDKICPKQSVILNLVNKRNLIAKQINNIYNSVNVLNKILNTNNTFITSLNAALVLFPLIPYPATGVPPILPPVTVGTISGIENGKETLKLTLEKITQGLKGTEYIIAYFAGVLAYLLYILSALDQLIQECSQEQNVPFDAINAELNSFVNQSTGISNSTVIGVIQNNTYKGFTLELKLDITNRTKYPKRYAQALTRQGVPVLKTESSFASDPQVLINQLKFIIDSNPNLTSE